MDRIPRKCRYNCLDTYSDLKRLPLVYQKAPEYLPRWNYETRFTVSEYLRFVEEDFGVRVSYRGLHTYCTKNFAGYLEEMRGNSFSLDEFCKRFEMDLDTARKALKSLCDKNIVQANNL